MNAIFKKRNPIILFVVPMLAALVGFGFCALILFLNKPIEGASIFACIFAAVVCLAFGLFPSFYNRKAYFRIDGNTVSGKFGFFKRLECDIHDVDFAQGKWNSLCLLIKNRKYDIRGMENARDVGAFIMRRVPFHFDGDKQEVIAALKKQDRDAIKYTRLAYGTVGLFLLLPFIALFLTGARDIPQFNLADWIIFSILCFLEISTMIAMFTFAIRTRRSTPIDLDKQIYAIRRATVETAPLPKTAWKLKAVLTDAYFCERITVYEGCMENNSTSCCFRVEMFEDDFQLKFAFESEFFENCEDLNLLQDHLDITKNFT